MSSYVFPVAGFNSGTAKITSGFGNRTAPTAGASTNHAGVDFAAATGTSVLAAAAGKVLTAAYSKSKGNYIQIQHANGDITEYEHLTARGVNAGETVRAGQKIGTVGSTGNSTGSHLHFGVMQNGKYIDPLKWGGVMNVTLPGAQSAASWFNAVKTGQTTSGSTQIAGATPVPAQPAGGLDLGSLGTAALDFVKKYFLWILAGLLVYAIITKKR